MLFRWSTLQRWSLFRKINITHCSISCAVFSVSCVVICLRSFNMFDLVVQNTPFKSFYREKKTFRKVSGEKKRRFTSPNRKMTCPLKKLRTAVMLTRAVYAVASTYWNDKFSRLRIAFTPGDKKLPIVFVRRSSFTVLVFPHYLRRNKAQLCRTMAKHRKQLTSDYAKAADEAQWAVQLISSYNSGC